MGIAISNNFTLSSPKNIDDRAGKFISGVWRPYVDLTEANSSISSFYRYNGLTVCVGTPSAYQEYWYYGGVGDEDLVIKSPTLKWTTKTASSTLLESEIFIRVDATTGDINLTLPSLATHPIVIKRVDTSDNEVNILGNIDETPSAIQPLSINSSLTFAYFEDETTYYRI